MVATDRPWPAGDCRPESPRTFSEKDTIDPCHINAAHSLACRLESVVAAAHWMSEFVHISHAKFLHQGGQCETILIVGLKLVACSIPSSPHSIHVATDDQRILSELLDNFSEHHVDFPGKRLFVVILRGA